jgi:hypothetical protein
MKTHFSEEYEGIHSANETADDHVWREHQIKKPQILGELIVMAAVLTGLFFLIATWGTTTMVEHGAPQQFVHTDHAAVPPPRLFDRDDGR